MSAGRRISLVAVGLVFAAVATGPGGGGLAAQTVDATAGQNFDRLTFGWPATVSYTAQRFGDTLLIEFGRPMTGDLASAAGGLGRYVASGRAEDGGRTIIVELTGNHSFQTSRNGSAVVVDVFPRDAAPPPRSSASAGLSPSAPASAPANDTVTAPSDRPADGAAAGSGTGSAAGSGAGSGATGSGTNDAASAVAVTVPTTPDPPASESANGQPGTASAQEASGAEGTASGASNAATSQPATSQPATSQGATSQPAASPSPAAETRAASVPVASPDASAGAALAAPDQVGPTVPVRTGTHPDRHRIVFDFPEQVPYSVEEKGEWAVLTFGQPASIDVGALNDRLPDGLDAVAASPTGDGLSVAVPRQGGVRHFYSGPKVVLDVLRPQDGFRSATSEPPLRRQAAVAVPAPAPETSTSTPPPEPAKPETAADPAEREKVAARFGLSSDTPAANAIPPATTNNATSPSAGGGAGAHGAGAKHGQGAVQGDDGAPTSLATGNDAGGGGQAIPPAHQGPQAGQQAHNGPTGPDAHGGTGSAHDVSETAAVVPAAVAAERNLEGATISGPTLPIAVAQTAEGLSIRFEWTEPVVAAVFSRAGYLWVVFDQLVTMDLRALNAQSWQIMGPATQIPVRPGSALRVPIVSGINPRVLRDGNAWVLDLRPQSQRPDVSLNVDSQMVSPQGPRVFVPSEDVGRVVTARDPEVGDLLYMVPILPLSRGIDGARRYAEFSILSSVQGVVVQPFSDDVDVRVLPDGIAIVRGGGLALSRETAVPSADRFTARIDGVPPGLPPGRIFDVTNWRRGGEADYVKEEQALQRRISEATSISRSGPRLELAQFYFANGLAAETVGLLRTIAAADEDLASRPDVKALRGASQFVLGRYAEAEEDLDERALNGFSEAELWRGAATAAQGKWAEAVEHFARAGEIPGGYPRNFATDVALWAAEAAIRAGDNRGAGSFLDVIAEGRPTPGEQARLDYLRGRVLYASGDVDTALNFWRDLADGDDRWSRVRARRAVVEHNLREGNITRIEAIEELESLRYTWRGDQLEFDLLRRLGGLYLEEGDYVAGLDALRQAVTFYPNNLAAAEVTERMTEAFTEIFTDGTSDAMTPLTALSLYDQFRELTPVGSRGDLIIQRLADRLVQVDLLDRASILLERQVKFRLQGIDKARVGARLALIRLLDRAPEQALEALDESVAPGLDKEVADERKRLRARAIFELGDDQTALKLINDDKSRDADLLRADIYWRTQEWGEAGPVFARLIGNAGQDGRRIDQRTATLILNRAVALSLSDKVAELNRMRQIYTSQMDNTPYREAFRLITNKSEGALDDFRTLTARFDEIGRFQAFLTSYRDKLRDQPLSSTN